MRTRNLISALIVLVGLACLCAAGIGHADGTSVATINPPNPMPTTPTTGWCYSATSHSVVTDTDYFNGVAACAPPVVNPPGQDPVGRLLKASVRYPNVSSVATLANVPMTDWTVFGRAATTDTVAPPFGRNGSAPAIIGFPGNGYIAWCMTPTEAAQVTVGVSTYYGWLVDAAWSPNAGDFHPANAASCLATKGAGESFPKLSTAPGWPGCAAPIGQQVCFNVRLHVPQTTNPTVAFNLGYLKH